MSPSTPHSLANTVLETIVDGLVLIDRRGIIQYVNSACVGMFGYDRDEMVGQNVKMLMPEPYQSAHDGYIESYRRTREAKIIGIGREVSGRRKDGTIIPVDLSVGDAKQTDPPLFVGVLRDLTERKRIEDELAQARKMETVGQLSAGVAHDFNNLLTVVIGNADLLHDALLSRPDLAKLAATIIHAGERGAQLTQRLLAFSRKQSLEPTHIDCNALITGLTPMLQRILREDIQLEIGLSPDIHYVFVDAAQLESALMNLAANARDAMSDGGHLTISTGRITLDTGYMATHLEVMPGDYIFISVTDDGTGMAPDVLARAFDPFFTTKGVGQGSGLGLSMVYGFVKQSNGNVSIYSESGLGTTVRLYLPVDTNDTPRDVSNGPELEPMVPD